MRSISRRASVILTCTALRVAAFLRYNTARNYGCIDAKRGAKLEEEQQGGGNLLLVALPASMVGCALLMVTLLVVIVILLAIFI